MYIYMYMYIHVIIVHVHVYIKINLQVYQENIYEEGAMFQSFYKVLHDMGPEFSDVQIISFNSTSKGYFGE